MDVLHGERPPAGGAFLLGLDGGLDAALAEDVAADCRCLLRQLPPADGAGESRLLSGFPLRF